MPLRYTLRLRCLHDSVSRLSPEFPRFTLPPLPATFRNMKKEKVKGVQGVDDRLVAILLFGLHTAHHKTEAAPPLPARRFSIARATSEVKASCFAGRKLVSKQQPGIHGSEEALVRFPFGRNRTSMKLSCGYWLTVWQIIHVPKVRGASGSSHSHCFCLSARLVWLPSPA